MPPADKVTSTYESAVAGVNCLPNKTARVLSLARPLIDIDLLSVPVPDTLYTRLIDTLKRAREKYAVEFGKVLLTS